MPIELEQYAKFAYPIKTPFGVIYGLKKIGGRCIFLDEAFMGCTTHLITPIDCKLYPMLLVFENGVPDIIPDPKNICSKKAKYNKQQIVDELKAIEWKSSWVKSYQHLNNY